VRRRILFVIAPWVVALGAAHTAFATTMRHLDTAALTLGSSDIVIGVVESTQPHWDAAHTRIVTDVNVRVTRTLKGAGGERITLTELGGEVDGVKYSIQGSAAFRPGEEALLFVWRNARGVAQVSGLAQGKFDIAIDAATGERLVRRPLPGFAVRDVKSLAQAAEGTPAPRLRLDDLVGEIQAVLGKGAGR
jgi:hypothetical protein